MKKRSPKESALLDFPHTACQQMNTRKRRAVLADAVCQSATVTADGDQRTSGALREETLPTEAAVCYQR